MVVRRVKPEPGTRQRWPDVPMQARTRRRIAIAVPVILALAVPGYIARWEYTEREATEPVEVVRAFLEASRSGDVEAALALTRGDPHTASQDLLVPEAMNADWEILDLDLQSWSPVDVNVDVWATVKGPGGTELTHPLSVELIDGDWKITDPFATLAVAALPVPYLEVNGITLPTEADDPREFVLLPGVYRLYEHDPALLSYEAEPLLALGERLVHADGAEIPGLVEAFKGFTVVADDEAALNERLTAYLDECLASPDGPESFGCPFGLDAYATDDPYFTPGGGNRWEIIEYPQAAAASVLNGTVYRSTDLALLTRHEGRARVTATDAATGDEHVLECLITTNGLYLTFDTTGDYTIGPNQDPNASTAPEGTEWDDDYQSNCRPT